MTVGDQGHDDSDPGQEPAPPWVRLEADLALRAAGLAARERDTEVAVRTRAERAALTLDARWRAAAESGAAVEVEVLGREPLAGTVVDAGADHVALATATGRAWVALTAVTAVAGLPPHAGAPPGAVAARWSLASVARRLAEAATPVRVQRRDAVTLVGRIVLVAADHLDLVVAGGGPGLRDGGGRRVTVAWTAVSCLEAVAGSLG